MSLKDQKDAKMNLESWCNQEKGENFIEREGVSHTARLTRLERRFRKEEGIDSLSERVLTWENNVDFKKITPEEVRSLVMGERLETAGGTPLMEGVNPESLVQLSYVIGNTGADNGYQINRSEYLKEAIYDCLPVEVLKGAGQIGYIAAAAVREILEDAQIWKYSSKEEKIMSTEDIEKAKQFVRDGRNATVMIANDRVTLQAELRAATDAQQEKRALTFDQALIDPRVLKWASMAAVNWPTKGEWGFAEECYEMLIAGRRLNCDVAMEIATKLTRSFDVIKALRSSKDQAQVKGPYWKFLMATTGWSKNLEKGAYTSLNGSKKGKGGKAPASRPLGLLVSEMVEKMPIGPVVPHQSVIHVLCQNADLVITTAYAGSLAKGIVENANRSSTMEKLARLRYREPGKEVVAYLLSENDMEDIRSRQTRGGAKSAKKMEDLKNRVEALKAAKAPPGEIAKIAAQLKTLKDQENNPYPKRQAARVENAEKLDVKISDLLFKQSDGMGQIWAMISKDKKASFIAEWNEGKEILDPPFKEPKDPLEKPKKPLEEPKKPLKEPEGPNKNAEPLILEDSSESSEEDPDRLSFEIKMENGTPATLVWVGRWMLEGNFAPIEVVPRKGKWMPLLVQRGHHSGPGRVIPIDYPSIAMLKLKDFGEWGDNKPKVWAKKWKSRLPFISPDAPMCGPRDDDDFTDFVVETDRGPVRFVDDEMSEDWMFSYEGEIQGKVIYDDSETVSYDGCPVGFVMDESCVGWMRSVASE